MGSSAVFADEHYYDGVTVDIDYEILGFVWIDDATVNFYPGAHVKDDYYYGDVYISSGAVVNLYGGQIDNVMMISTMYNDLPDAQVTVYGTDFAVDGVPVDPDTTDLFLQGEVLSGVYEDGTPFSYAVECFWEGDVYLTLSLVWLNGEDPEPAEGDIEAAPVAVDFADVELGTHALQIAAVLNTGDGPLTVDSIKLEDDSMQFFLSAVTLPAVLEPNEALEFGVVYVPAETAEAAGVLKVLSDDPDEQEIEIALSGAGFVELTPLERIDAILAAFDQAVEDGTIVGNAGWWWWYNDKMVRQMKCLLKTARHLIEKDQFHCAVQVLHVADLKSDGKTWPCDYVKGDGVAELNRLIKELEEKLKTL